MIFGYCLVCFSLQNREKQQLSNYGSNETNKQQHINKAIIIWFEWLCFVGVIRLFWKESVVVDTVSLSFNGFDLFLSLLSSSFLLTFLLAFIRRCVCLLVNRKIVAQSSYKNCFSHKIQRKFVDSSSIISALGEIKCDYPKKNGYYENCCIIINNLNMCYLKHPVKR